MAYATLRGMLIVALIAMTVSRADLRAQDKPELGEPKSISARTAALNYQAELEKLEAEFAKRRAELREQYMRDLDEARKEALQEEELDEAQRILALKASIQNESDAGARPPARSARRSGLTVMHAFFGTGSSWADVTPQTKKHIKGSRLRLDVPYHGRDLASVGFPDPAPNRLKTLVVVYSFDGQIGAAAAHTNQRLEIPSIDE